LSNTESNKFNIIWEAKALKIEKLRLESKEGRARAAAKVVWEDCDRPTQELFFETDIEFADGFSCNPHAFLVGCILPAMRYGEKRIFVDAEICPELRDGLMTVMSWMRHWYYGEEKALVQIETKKRSSPPIPRRQERAGVFFSGGIDSLATLRANRLNYPLEHPGSIKDGLVVYGLEVFEEEKFDHVLNSMSEIARDAAITLIPVYTNIRNVGPEDEGTFWSFWAYEFMGAAFGAIAHTFSKRLNRVMISSCHDIPNVMPYGSHPMINPNYSSTDLSIKHFGITLSRFEKTRLISDWDVALRHLRVCNESLKYRPGALNCGECEKCLRTKVALLALGVLERTSAFADNEISPERVQKTVRLSKATVGLYKELLAPLSENGYQDLVRVIKRRITDYKWRQRTIQPIRKFDHKYLNDSLVGLKRLVYEKGIT
jgi:hypothetical protein